MALKSVLDIDVQDAKFQRFVDLFNRYNETLEKQPQIYKEMEQRHSSLATGFERVTAALSGQTVLLRDALQAQRDQAVHLTTSERLWTSIGRSSGDLVHNIASATERLIKWTSILGAVGGLLGLGGLFGIDRLGANIAGQRRSGMGYGTTTGELAAFRTNFGRLVDTDSFLGNVNEMELDITRQAPAMQLLGHPLTGRTANDAVEILRRLREFSQTVPLNQLQTQLTARGWNLGDEDARRLHDMGGAEFSQLVAGFQRDRNTLGASDPLAKRWADFTTQMERASQRFTVTLAGALAPLAGPLAHLSASFVKAVEAFAGSDLVKDGINGLARWLEQLNAQVASQRFLENIRAFASDVGDLAHMFHLATHPTEGLATDWTFLKDSVMNGVRHFERWATADPRWARDHMDAWMGRLDEHYHIGPGTLELFKRLENSGANSRSPSGAMGMFQLMPDTARQYGVANAYDPVTSAEGAAKYIAHLMERYHGDRAEVLAAYNAGEGAVDRAIDRYGSARWLSGLPRETQAYVGRGLVEIQITDATGGSVNIAAHQVGAGATP